MEKTWKKIGKKTWKDFERLGKGLVEHVEMRRKTQERLETRRKTQEHVEMHFDLQGGITPPPLASPGGIRGHFDLEDMEKTRKKDW